MSRSTEPLRDPQGRFESECERKLRYRIATLEHRAEAAVRAEHAAWRLLSGVVVALLVVGAVLWVLSHRTDAIPIALLAVSTVTLAFGPNEHDMKEPP